MAVGDEFIADAGVIAKAERLLINSLPVLIERWFSHLLRSKPAVRDVDFKWNTGISKLSK